MRLSDDARYPHPVLGPLTTDYTEGEFTVSFHTQEDMESGAFALRHDIHLTEPFMLQMVQEGKASVGCIVVCRDTYYNQLQKLSFPNGVTEFPQGSLLNRVTLRPVIWLNAEQQRLDSINTHPEFGSVMVSRGDILGLDEEYLFSVGKAKLATMESIFQLISAPDLPEGIFEVDLEGGCIGIMLAPATLEIINVLRGQGNHQSALLSAIYLPAIMETLDRIRSAPDNFVDSRWYATFVAKCDMKGIVLNENTQLAQAAQMLLENPVSKLEELLKGDTQSE